MNNPNFWLLRLGKRDEVISNNNNHKLIYETHGRISISHRIKCDFRGMQIQEINRYINTLEDGRQQIQQFCEIRISSTLQHMQKNDIALLFNPGKTELQDEYELIKIIGDYEPFNAIANVSDPEIEFLPIREVKIIKKITGQDRRIAEELISELKHTIQRVRRADRRQKFRKLLPPNLQHLTGNS